MASDSQDPISPVTISKPKLTISAAAITDEPVELDGTSATADQAQLLRRGSKAAALEALHAEQGLSPAERERRAKLILERKSNPAVLVDIPQGPGPEELEKSEVGKDEAQDTTATKTGRAQKAS